MCLVSDKIKFCTCNVGEAHILNHYWILYRHNKDKNELVIGMTILPDDFTPFYEENKEIISRRLNDTDAFDIPIDFKNRDHLEIVFNNHFDKPGVNRMEYYFVYKAGMWRLTENNPFHLESHFDDIKFGEIKNV
jgi:hypothetical protein